MEKRFRIGVISSTHGLKGEVKVYPTTDDVNRYKKIKNVCLVNSKSEIEVEIESVRFFKNMVILKMKGFDVIEQVEGLKGSELYVERQDAIELKENEFYIADMIGATAILTDGTKLGIVSDIMPTGANEVFVVESELYGQLLIPSIKDCIKKIEPEASTVIMELMDGILPDKKQGEKNNLSSKEVK